ncbi:uncharacterized protein LOC101862848 isoform X2 [Aplysia californica]|uniref:Uncharacterized protein LOC101862848 isoform X2 n=1 Tax=Aplysia californica TaxID=6500 RepID=A0ABM1VX32_APLCA|nr:uncharacterized protein LOC101862848 isoform X2 [Aplysia californica]XP_035826974.1 uncharacterized protein LOC101862848 isoform X2 [Aplysia californica]
MQLLDVGSGYQVPCIEGYCQENTHGWYENRKNEGDGKGKWCCKYEEEENGYSIGSTFCEEGCCGDEEERCCSSLSQGEIQAIAAGAGVTVAVFLLVTIAIILYCFIRRSGFSVHRSSNSSSFWEIRRSGTQYRTENEDTFRPRRQPIQTAPTEHGQSNSVRSSNISRHGDHQRNNRNSPPAYSELTTDGNMFNGEGPTDSNIHRTDGNDQHDSIGGYRTTANRQINVPGQSFPSQNDQYYQVNLPPSASQDPHTLSGGDADSQLLDTLQDAMPLPSYQEVMRDPGKYTIESSF